MLTKNIYINVLCIFFQTRAILPNDSAKSIYLGYESPLLS